METQRDWLTGYELQSLGDFELTPGLDRDLSRRALAARRDPGARDELFIMLATKIARFSNRLRRWTAPTWELDDVFQETFIAFDDVITDWRPLDRDGPPSGFGYYFLSVFAYRLRDRVTALGDPRWASRSSAPLASVVDSLPGDDDVALNATTTALLEQICGRLNATDAAILRHRAAGLEFDTVQLRGSGITASRRTVYRRWRRIVTIAREVRGEQRAAS
ncbi:MAG TPA: hypothetical protein VMM78_16180 [Thermomicrobiales bacterium]|nr:hypothetical protein [Thermomicrobiales bacterium]